VAAGGSTIELPSEARLLAFFCFLGDALSAEAVGFAPGDRARLRARRTRGATGPVGFGVPSPRTLRAP